MSASEDIPAMESIVKPSDQKLEPPPTAVRRASVARILSPNYTAARDCCIRCTGDFPDIPTIGGREIMKIRENGTPPLILIDCRLPEEREVSMIEGAITVEEFNKGCGEGGPYAPDTLKDQGAVVVPYCTIGFRSGICARRLRDEGHTNVQNSEGIVMYTHDSGILVTEDGQQTKRVHTYGATWNLAADGYETVQFGHKSWIQSHSKFVWRFLVSVWKKMFPQTTSGRLGSFAVSDTNITSKWLQIGQPKEEKEKEKKKSLSTTSSANNLEDLD